MSDLNIAREIWKSRLNGACEGMSESKGGRVWLDGEFQLDELESLCIILRDLAGERAWGLEEYKNYWTNK